MALGGERIDIAKLVAQSQGEALFDVHGAQLPPPMTDQERILRTIETVAAYTAMGRVAGGGMPMLPDVIPGMVMRGQQPAIASSPNSISDNLDPAVAAAMAQLQKDGLTVTAIDVASPQPLPQPKIKHRKAKNTGNRKKLLSTRPRKLAFSSATLAIVLATTLATSDSARNAIGIDSSSAAAEAIPTTDSDTTPEVDEIINTAITKELTVPSATEIASSSNGTPESKDDGAKTVVSQPVELTTDLGALSGDTVSLNLNNLKISWQLKIPEPKFTFSTTAGSMQGVIRIDPSSFILVPVLASQPEWSTVSEGGGVKIDEALKKLNPGITPEQLAASKAKAEADLTASSDAVNQQASIKIISELVGTPEYLRGLNNALGDLIVSKLTSPNSSLNRPELKDYEITIDSDSTVVDPTKIVADYAAAFAATPAGPISPNVSVTGPVNGIKSDAPVSKYKKDE